VLVLCGVALSGVGGVDRQVAGAAPHETPARKIIRLRAKAARVQAAIDRMHARVESLVEDYNAVREDLARTRTEQARTRRQVVAARRQLRAAKRLLGQRLWTIYTGGAPSTLGQLLGADSVHDALVTTKYQEQVVGADRAALDRVDRLRRQVEALAARLADQAERQERLRARLAAKRRQIESRLAAQAPLPQAPGQKAAAGGHRGAPPSGAAPAPGHAAPAGRRAGGPGTGAGRRAEQHVVGRRVGWGRRPDRGRGPGGRLRPGPAGQAIHLGGVRAELVRLLGPDHGRLPQRRGVAARVSRAQWGAGPHVGLGSLAPGDLVFFAHNTGNPSTIHHVGIYIGGGAMIEAP